LGVSSIRFRYKAPIRKRKLNPKGQKRKSGYVFPEIHVPLYCGTVDHIIQRREMSKSNARTPDPMY
jgi:hypothetical protein